MSKPAIRNLRKRFDLHGRDAPEVERRVETLRNALRQWRGHIVRLRWQRDAVDRISVRVVYELPERMVSAEPGQSRASSCE